ncbi:unnamed protein product [Orchesella dallaii]|uniref:RNase H type-1 domain-containing protein n=1 Tax=Orchesella dallaii TaxID=48710 RepID=A0ABP1RTW1_9HEXA
MEATNRNGNRDYHSSGPLGPPPAPLYIPFRSHHSEPRYPCRYPPNNPRPTFYEGRGCGGPSYSGPSLPPACHPHHHPYRQFERPRHFRCPPSYNYVGRHNCRSPQLQGGQMIGGPGPGLSMGHYYPSHLSPPPGFPQHGNTSPLPPFDHVLRTSIATQSNYYPGPNRISRVNLREIRNFKGRLLQQYPMVSEQRERFRNGKDTSVAVEPVSPQNGCNIGNDSSTDDDDEEEDEGSSTDISDCPRVEEEYEPEHPEITAKPSCPQSLSVASDKMVEESHTITDTNEMNVCDEDGFYEVFVGVCVSRYPTGTGRTIEVAGYGVWTASGQQISLSGVLDSNRPHTIKPVMIFGSAKAVEFMKNHGYSRIRLNLESDYLNKNVLGWISKYMENPDAQPANWDEYKYQVEIKALCASATGMIIKWSHVFNASNKRMGLLKARHLAKAATDTWIKELKIREEAVGTGTYD